MKGPEETVDQCPENIDVHRLQRELKLIETTEYIVRVFPCSFGLASCLTVAHASLINVEYGGSHCCLRRSKPIGNSSNGTGKLIFVERFIW